MTEHEKLVERISRAVAEKLTDVPWECVCSERRGLECDCGDAMEDDHVDRYDERLTRNMCRAVARAAVAECDTALTLANARIAGLEEALAGIAEACDDIPDSWEDHRQCVTSCGHFRRARAALKGDA